MLRAAIISGPTPMPSSTEVNIVITNRQTVTVLHHHVNKPGGKKTQNDNITSKRATHESTPYSLDLGPRMKTTAPEKATAAKSPPLVIGEKTCWKDVDPRTGGHSSGGSQ